MPTGTISVPSTALGARLRDLRMRRKWTQTQVAAALGTGANRVSDWETGRFEPTLAVLQRFAEIYGMTVSGLLREVM